MLPSDGTLALWARAVRSQAISALGEVAAMAGLASTAIPADLDGARS